MPQEFDEMGVRFQYPDNWTVSKDAATADCRSVTVASPRGAFWTLSVHPRMTDSSEIIKTVFQAMREEYKEVESDEIEEEYAGFDLTGRDFNFYCLDLTNTAWIRCLQTNWATYMVFCQAEDREFAEVADVFRAMTMSFLSNVST